uniref:L1 transposable element RRM domain-containing protein n=1 Tax=Kryptolebias marmoratus TaxID=37003 RepID=A0A3Q3AYA0_KRYMA
MLSTDIYELCPRVHDLTGPGGSCVSPSHDCQLWSSTCTRSPESISSESGQHNTQAEKSQLVLLLQPPSHATSPPRGDSPPGPDELVGGSPSSAFKSELLSALRVEMALIFKTELQAALTENLASIKAELLAVKSEFTNTLATIQRDVRGLKDTVAELETSCSTFSDDITTLQAKVEQLTADMKILDNKCDDLEARSRRNNLRLIGISEDFSVSSTAISTLLKEAFQLEKEPLVDRAHRTLQPKPRPGERPRAIIVRLHYHSDCMDILRRARTQQPVKIGDRRFSVFPDHTPRTARARAAYNDVRRQLREIPGIRFGLLYPARLRVTHNGTEREFKSPEEASVFIRSLKS